ncbi:MAG: C40 family peptidase [Actinomycetales bacterium]
MSTVNTLGRHRAATASTNPLTVISKAVSSNAGTFGRQAAIVTAASALILSVGLPAQAAQTGRVSADTIAVQTAAQPVSVPAATPASFVSSQVESTPAPVVVQAPQIKAEVAAQVKTATAAVTAAATTVKAAAAAQPAPAPAVAVGTGHAGVVAAAYTGIGHAYVHGGTSPVTGWDCSGFVQWAYAQAGIHIPRVNQWSVMVQTSNPQPGDLVVQNGGVHVGIYVGNGMIISALNPSQGTMLLPASATGTSVFYTLP